jgi:N-acetylglucosaminyl-diphospho-decaprenol L-rhamnosyltransferase
VEPDPTAAPGPPWRPARYGAGLAVLVVGTGGEPFPARAPVPCGAAATGPVILVDSGAPGGVPAGGARSGATVLRIGEDIGRGAAVNRAVAALPPDVGLLAVTPPGLRWADGALDELRAAAARHPRAGVLAPAVHDRSGAPVPSTHPLPRPARGVVAVLRHRPWPPPSSQDAAVEGPTGWTSAPALLLRRVALDSVDGFDPRYPGRLDDLDLAERLTRAGWLTVHVPAAVVCHPGIPERPDVGAARRYLADRVPRPVRALLRARP